MLDVHAPHGPTHGWRDFLVHIAAIAIGVLLALALEKLAEHLHERRQLSEARRELASQRAAVGTPTSWPRDTNWLSAAKELSEAAVRLGDLELAAELELVLEPFADRMVVSARSLFCMGSVSGALGRLADLRGDLKVAAERYARAIDQEERAGALVWAAHHRLRLGQALLAAGDEDGRTFMAVVAAEGQSLGLDRLAAEAARSARRPTRTRSGR